MDWDIANVFTHKSELVSPEHWMGIVRNKYLVCNWYGKSPIFRTDCKFLHSEKWPFPYGLMCYHFVDTSCWSMSWLTIHKSLGFELKGDSMRKKYWYLCMSNKSGRLCSGLSSVWKEFYCYYCFFFLHCLLMHTILITLNGLAIMYLSPLSQILLLTGCRISLHSVLNF